MNREKLKKKDWQKIIFYHSQIHTNQFPINERKRKEAICNFFFITVNPPNISFDNFNTASLWIQTTTPHHHPSNAYIPNTNTHSTTYKHFSLNKQYLHLHSSPLFNVRKCITKKNHLISFLFLVSHLINDTYIYENKIIQRKLMYIASYRATTIHTILESWCATFTFSDSDFGTTCKKKKKSIFLFKIHL